MPDGLRERCTHCDSLALVICEACELVCCLDCELCDGGKCTCGHEADRHAPLHSPVNY